ncbi:hypothetical protein ACOME3_010830 [Neoechinorhynchus agilis]
MLTILLFLFSVPIAYNLPKNENLSAHSSNYSLSASTTLSPITDEKWPDSWYLHRSAYNIERVWNEGYTGKGVVVGIMDFGIEQNHPDLNDRVLATLPNSSVFTDHGNGCAGIIAGKPDNNICGVESMIDIYSVSIGPPDDGSSVFEVYKHENLVVANNARLGRNGLGSSFVIASGNGGQFLDNCAVNERVNSHYAIAVAAILRNHSSPYYAEKCATIMTTGYTSDGSSNQIITAGLNGTCRDFDGTSAVAPMVAAIIALGLEANPHLDYRQIQYLVVMSSVKHENMTSYWPTDEQWWKNGAGYWVSKYFGFGILDPKSFVDNAISMKGRKLPKSNTCKVRIAGYTWLRSDSTERFRVYTNACDSSSSAITSLEHVILNVNIEPFFSNPGQRGKLRIVLVSPTNNSVEMLDIRPLDDDRVYGFRNHSFTSVLNWFEDPRGYWEARVFNSDKNGSFIVLKMDMILIGVNGNPLKT